MNGYKFNIKPTPHKISCVSYKQTNAVILPEVDLREWDSPVDSQHTIGSCGASALVNAYENMVKHHYPDKFVDLSRLYVYYHTRYLENTVQSDDGVVYLRSALRAVEKYGVCPESVWPYDITKFLQQPSPDAYVAAEDHKIESYRYLQTLKDMLEVLSKGDPFIVGITVYPGFMTLSPADSALSMPETTDIEMGGHAMSIVGYNMDDAHFIAKNSFGTAWGDKGYCYIPFEYMRLYAFDKWCFTINDQE